MEEITIKGISKGKVLIIEDEGDTCFLLKNILKQQQFEIEQVNTLAQAAIFLKDDNPSLIFLDNHLPDGLGMNFIEYVKKNYPDIKIVMITAHDSNADKRNALSKGADLFLSKPFTKEDILRSVKQLLAESKLGASAADQF